MTGLGAPVAIRWGSNDPTAPLIVLLQGPGDATEKDLAAFAPLLPVGAGYASVRVPLPPSEHSFASFRRWLDEQAAPQVPVVLVGFGSGATFAGGLLLADPTRFAAAALLYGTLPFEAGLPVTRGRLVGVPVFVNHGLYDTVLPAEPQRRTWDYLVRESGSPHRLSCRRHCSGGLRSWTASSRLLARSPSRGRGPFFCLPASCHLAIPARRNRSSQPFLCGRSLTCPPQPYGAGGTWRGKPARPFQAREAVRATASALGTSCWRVSQ
jgi:predicted esterase